MALHDYKLLELILFRALPRCDVKPLARNPTPSKADIDMTNKLYALASQFNIVVHDHLIIGRVDELSFKNLGLLEPQAPNF